MELQTKQDLAIIYWLKDLFSSQPLINVVDSYDPSNLVIPTVAVDSLDLDAYEHLELGNRKWLHERTWDIDIFAVNRTQRDEIGYKIVNALDTQITVYDYALGFPPSSLPVIGCLDPEDIHLRNIPVIPALVEKMYYRSLISFRSTYKSV